MLCEKVSFWPVGIVRGRISSGSLPHMPDIIRVTVGDTVQTLGPSCQLSSRSGAALLLEVGAAAVPHSSRSTTLLSQHHAPPPAPRSSRNIALLPQHRAPLAAPRSSRSIALFPLLPVLSQLLPPSCCYSSTLTATLPSKSCLSDALPSKSPCRYSVVANPRSLAR